MKTKIKLSKTKIFYLKMKKKILLLLLSFLVLIGIAIGILYTNKDIIIQNLIFENNKKYQGQISIKSIDFSFLKQFPYTSIQLNNLNVWETKDTLQKPIVSIKKAYLGFNLWSLIQKDYNIKKIALQDGNIHLIQDKSNILNIQKAFETKEKDASESVHFDINEIILEQIDIKKENVLQKTIVEVDAENAKAQFSYQKKHIALKLDSKFLLNVFKSNKPTFINQKHFELHTDFIFDRATHLLTFKKTSVELEHAQFEMKGKIDVDNDMFVDLNFHGEKKNFDLLLAMAPNDIAQTLKTYDNKGNIFFDAKILGKTINGNNPLIEARFGCKEGYILNSDVNKKVDELGFLCTFSNGANHNASSSVFELSDFSAKPEAGIFKAKMKVVNFESPEIDMQIDSDFDLNFLTKFLKLYHLKNLEGKVLLSMKFHDIVDLKNPEKSLEKLNQAYYSKLKISNLNFKSKSYPQKISNLNVDASMEGETLFVKNCNFNINNSDIQLTGKVKNIPALIHQNHQQIESDFHFKSKKLDFNDFYISKNKNINEIASNLKLDFLFKGAANTFVTSKTLPLGQFYLTNLSGKLKNYKHELKAINGLFYIKPNDIIIKRLDGKMDASDFHFKGNISHYELWLSEIKQGRTTIDFDFNSNNLILKDVFTYNNHNYIPVEYQDETVEDFKFHGKVSLDYQDSLKATDFYLTHFKAKFKRHPIAFHHLKGHFHLENKLLNIKSFEGKLGENDWNIKGIYALENVKANSKLYIHSNNLNLNELFSYTLKENENVKDHDSGFNIFKEPFPNLNIYSKVKTFKYKNYNIKNMLCDIEIKENHMVYLNQFKCQVADGIMDAKGYFNGSNPNNIYIKPDIKIQKVDLDQMMIKFDNFGQDRLVSDNIHGQFSGRITGKLYVHSDFVPNIQKSNLKMDVLIENGRLDNFAPLESMSSYFGNKNLKKIKFDTLSNTFFVNGGVMSFPNMNINSSLGYIEVSGKQDMDLKMDYFVRVPLKLVSKAVFTKLFKKLPESINEQQEDDIIIRDPQKRLRFLNLRILGTPENYKISVERVKNENKEIKKSDTFLFNKIEDEIID
jgi:hypothetical protein